MICQCGNTEALYKWFTVDCETCDRCGTSGTFTSPDVYFKEPYWDEHLASEEHPGAKFISSRAEKAHWLKQCHLRENGDRVHGATNFDPISYRHAQASLRRPQPCPTK